MMPIFDEDLTPEQWAQIEANDAREFERREEERHRFYEEPEPEEES